MPKLKITKTKSMMLRLHDLRVEGWDAIIAGGAIRDLWHDKPIRDVDIFASHIYKTHGVLKNLAAPYESDVWLDYWFDAFKCNHDSEDEVLSIGSAYGGDDSIDPDMCWVWEIRRTEIDKVEVLGLEAVIPIKKVYQVILVKKNPVDFVMQNFDFGLCKAYTDGKRIHMSGEFMEDALNHRLTLGHETLNERQQDRAVYHHLPRLLGKYPGYQVILPDRYDEMPVPRNV